MAAPKATTQKTTENTTQNTTEDTNQADRIPHPSPGVFDPPPGDALPLDQVHEAFQLFVVGVCGDGPTALAVLHRLLGVGQHVAIARRYQVDRYRVARLTEDVRERALRLAEQGVSVFGAGTPPEKLLHLARRAQAEAQVEAEAEAEAGAQDGAQDGSGQAGADA